MWVLQHPLLAGGGAAFYTVSTTSTKEPLLTGVWRRPSMVEVGSLHATSSFESDLIWWFVAMWRIMIRAVLHKPAARAPAKWEVFYLIARTHDNVSDRLTCFISCGVCRHTPGTGLAAFGNHDSKLIHGVWFEARDGVTERCGVCRLEIQ